MIENILLVIVIITVIGMIINIYYGTKLYQRNADTHVKLFVLFATIFTIIRIYVSLN
jgi:hypothetical protein